MVLHLIDRLLPNPHPIQQKIFFSTKSSKLMRIQMPKTITFRITRSVVGEALSYRAFLKIELSFVTLMRQVNEVIVHFQAIL